MRTPLRLGLTGGIGSGKSTVATLLATYRTALIDADAISRQLTAPTGLAIAPIEAEFGAIMVQSDGAMDRQKMRTLVYADDQVRHRLEAILHPLIGEEATRQVEQAIQSNCDCIVFDIPLLVESKHWRIKLDHVLVIDCSPERQIDRVMARSGLRRDAVAGILAAQATRQERLRAADSTIFNDDISLHNLSREVAQWAKCFGLSSPTDSPETSA